MRDERERDGRERWGDRERGGIEKKKYSRKYIEVCLYIVCFLTQKLGIFHSFYFIYFLFCSPNTRPKVHSRSRVTK